MVAAYSLPRKISLFFCILFYGFLGLAGAIWIHFTGRQKLTELLTPANSMQVLALGVGCAALIALLTRFATVISPLARYLEEEFGLVLGKQPRGEAFVIALVSSTAEEIFFRGAMMQNIGLPLTTVIFALVHWPMGPRMIMWPFYALFVGLVLGFQVQWTGGIMAPIITHFLINFVNMMIISERYGKFGEMAR